MQVRCYPRAFAPLANPTQWVSSTNSQATAFTPNPMRNALTFSMLADVPLNLYSGSCGSRQKTPEISLPKWELWQIRSLKRFRKCQRHPSRRLHMMQMTQNDRPGAFMKIPGKIRGQGKSGYRRDVPHFQDVPKVFHRNLFHFCDQQPLLRNLNRPNWEYARTHSQRLSQLPRRRTHSSLHHCTHLNSQNGKTRLRPGH